MHLVKMAGYSKKGSPHWRGNVDSQMTAQGTLQTLSDEIWRAAFPIDGVRFWQVIFCLPHIAIIQDEIIIRRFLPAPDAGYY